MRERDREPLSYRLPLFVRRALAAAALRLAASLFRVQPALGGGGAGTRLAAAFRHDKRAADQIRETFAGVLAILRLRAMRTRVDHEDPLVRHPASGQRL